MCKITRLNEKTEAIKHLIGVDDKFILLYHLVGEISFRLNNDPYAFIIETIIGQMFSNKVSDIIVERLLKLCDSKKIDIASIRKLSLDELRSIGISNRKAQCILDFTERYCPEQYSRKRMSRLSNEEIINIITATKGLGMWSAKMFLLFVLGREDILPFEDVAFLQAFKWYHGFSTMPKINEIKGICGKWSPYTSIAARYLYKALDKGFTKSPFVSYL